MSILTYVRNLGRRTGTPQQEPIPGTVPNAAGGYAFPVDLWTRLERFLVLGSEGGSYYATERTLTRENGRAVEACLAADGVRTVRAIAELSRTGRAPRQGPAIFALALALKTGDEATKAEARTRLPEIVRTGTHLFMLAEAVKAIGGWGRGTRRAFASWYLTQPPADLAYQLVKYQRRDGWSTRDVLRKAHPKAKGPTQELLSWAVNGWETVSELPPPDLALSQIWAFEKAKRATTAAELVPLVSAYGLPRECVPTQLLGDREVWEALVDNGGRGMPLGALVRNLAKLTVVGVLKPLGEGTERIAALLRDPARIRASRLHPLALLVAQRTYASGRGDKGSLTWEPVPEIVRALEDAFHLAFQNVAPTGKRLLLALDVSGSMGTGRVAGSPLTPREAAAALAVVTLARERRVHVVAFRGAEGLAPLALEGKGIQAACALAQAQDFGGTDCALPMKYARQHGLEVDGFVVFTDSETWAGTPHPVEALRQYRAATGIAAKLVVVGLVSNGFSIADPTDAGMLDVVGFDTAAPAVMADFLAR